MMWLFAILIVLVMGGIAMVASGRGGSMPPAYDDRPDLVLPADRAIEAADLRRVRFPLALRGYRMSEVDELLARLATELEDAAAPEPQETIDEPAEERPVPPAGEDSSGGVARD
jgi:DivIVA domain-containing protein